MKWNGTAEYTFRNANFENTGRHDQNEVLLRLEPSAEVNSHWHVNARIDVNVDLKNDTKAEDGGDFSLRRVWAQGDYDNFSVKLGKFATIDADSIADKTLSGVEVSFGSPLKFTIGAGRLNNVTVDEYGDYLYHDYCDIALHDDITGNYQYVALDYSRDKLDLGAHYHHINFDNFWYKADGAETDEFNLWKVNAGYKFDGNWALAGYYGENHDADEQKKIAAVELNYKGAERERPGSWGAWAAYRHLGANAVIFSTYETVNAGFKGWEVGGDYTLARNVVLTGRYGRCKTIRGGDRFDTAFGRVNFYF